MNTTLSREPFGRLPDGSLVERFTLAHPAGLTASILDYGGIVTALNFQGQDVVLGFDGLEPYLERHPYFGCIVGRYANRIAGARFRLDGVEYSLFANDGPNHLHGGCEGFDRKRWRAEVLQDKGGARLQLHYRSPDGEEGYPGTLDCTVTYSLTSHPGLRIHYRCTTDRPTVVNLTNHSYFNLADGGASSVLEHCLQLEAEAFTPVDERLIPTGELRAVQGTPFDFRTPQTLGARIEAADEQLRLGHGYDHNFVLRGTPGTLRRVATLQDPTGSRTLEVWTTAPGMQLYTANHLKGDLRGKGRVVYGRRCALCLETQCFPDSPNQPAFPSPVLRPGELWQSVTEYRFRGA